jgi:hypothetical protein
MSLAARYGDKDLQLICDYMDSASEVTKRELAQMVATNAWRSPRVKSAPPSRG